MIVDKNYDPCIVFTFDKKMIEEQAKALDRLDLNSDTEKSMIDAIFEASIDQLSPEDQNLPQVVSLLPILKRGIGFHHSGLLPVLKEVIEILFQEGLIKVLIAMMERLEDSFHGAEHAVQVSGVHSAAEIRRSGIWIPLDLLG